MTIGLPWREHGKCASLTPQEADTYFFLTKGKSPKPAKIFCAGCPVRKQCLYYAIYYKQKGIWAGTTDDERDELRPFIIAEVIEAMSVVVYENHSVDDHIASLVRSAPTFESIHKRSESSGRNDERLVS